MTFDRHTELQLLEALEEEPETSQADLAARVGVAVGTVNWYMKRWSKKGYVIIKRIDRWRWRYILTPQGAAEKAVLARKYVEASMAIYRRTRIEAKLLLDQVEEAGFRQVVIDGDGDIAEICQLTSIEQGIQAIAENEGETPVIHVLGQELVLDFPESENS